MSRSRILSGAGALMADKIVITAIQLALVPVLANVWGLELYGIWAMMTTIPVFLAMGDFGIVAAAWARMTAFLAREEWGRARGVLHTAWLAAIVSAALLAAVAAAILLSLPTNTLPSVAEQGFGDTASRHTAITLVLYGLGMIVFRLNTAIFRAGGRFPLAIVCNTASYGLENLALVVAVVSGADPLTAALTMLSMRCLAIALVFTLSFRLFPRLSPGFTGASRSEWAELWRPALSASAFSFSLVLFLQGSVIALGSVAGPAAVPAFVAVRTVSRLGIQIIALIGGPMAQEFGHVAARQEWFAAGRYFAIVAGSAVIMGSAMALGLLLLGPFAIDLWTAGAIQPHYSLIAAMAASSLLGVVWSPLSNLVLSVNRQNAIAIPALVSAAIGLTVIALLGRELGATAAGLAYAISDLVTLTVIAAFIARHWLVRAEFRHGMADAVRHVRSHVENLLNRKEKGPG